MCVCLYVAVCLSGSVCVCVSCVCFWCLVRPVRGRFVGQGGRGGRGVEDWRPYAMLNGLRATITYCIGTKAESMWKNVSDRQCCCCFLVCFFFVVLSLPLRFSVIPSRFLWTLCPLCFVHIYFRMWRDDLLGFKLHTTQIWNGDVPKINGRQKKKRQRLSYDVAWNCFSSFFFCFAKNNYIFIWYLWIVDDQLRTHAISDLLICCGRLAGCSIALRVLNDGEWSTWRCSFPVWCIFVVDELRKLILLTKRFERVISRWKENMLTRAFCCQLSISLFCLPSKLVCVCCSICVCVYGVQCGVPWYLPHATSTLECV